LDPRDRIIVYVGRLVATKGIFDLLAAFTELCKGDSFLRLVLVGDGVMRMDMEQAVQRLGLEHRVRLPGGKGHLDVARWLAASDMLCLPSWSEGYPNVVVEAIACGRPVVACDVGGTSEIVTASNGLLVPRRNPARLATAIREVLDRTWDESAVSRTVQRSWMNVAKETLHVCLRATSRTSS
jgi:glycosyltransferase involved in cell wall biosynthesis